MSLPRHLLTWMAHPILTLAYLGARRRVSHCQADADCARRSFGPGSTQENEALDRLEAAMERRHRARLRLHERTGFPTPSM